MDSKKAIRKPGAEHNLMYVQGWPTIFKSF